MNSIVMKLRHISGSRDSIKMKTKLQSPKNKENRGETPMEKEFHLVFLSQKAEE